MSSIMRRRRGLISAIGKLLSEGFGFENPRSSQTGGSYCDPSLIAAPAASSNPINAAKLMICQSSASGHTPPAQESKLASIGDENAGCAPAQFQKGAAPCLDGVVSNKTYRFNTGWPRGLKKSASKQRNSHLVPNGTPSSRKHVGLISRPT